MAKTTKTVNASKQMEALIKKLNKECEDLEKKIGALTTFISDEHTRDKVGYKQFRLLTKQRKLMRGYSEVLVNRITELKSHL